MKSSAELTNMINAQSSEQLSPSYERLRPKTLSELKNLPPRNMLVKGLLGVGEMSVFFGEPKCGKSFLVTHLGLAIAAGQDWAGKKVKHGPVVYVAAEGAGGFAKRIEAHSQHNDGIEGAQFYSIMTSVNMLDPEADLEPLIYWIRHYGALLVVLDTLSRTMQGGNENSPDHMGAYIANCDKIREETGAHVLIIHHKPKGSDKNTPRGHSSLFGAVDALVRISKSTSGSVAIIEASKDDAGGWKVGFNLKVIEVDKDEDGEAITSCAGVISDEVPEDAEKPLSLSQSEFMHALWAVLTTHGISVQNHPTINNGTKCIRSEKLKVEFCARWDGKYEAQSRAYNRVRDDLRKKGRIGFRDGFIWDVKSKEKSLQPNQT